MSEQHTPGRLSYEYEPGYCGELIASNGTTIATFNDELIEANARRLVACWNACEGISTKSLESAGNAFNGWKLASYAMNDTKSQRDELMAAAEKALAECCDLIATPAGDALAAAIAKVKGGAA